MDLTQQQKDEKYEYYIAEAKKLDTWYRKLSQNLDTLIFGISSGSLVLSVNFIDKFNNLESLWLLELAWVFFLLTLFINLVTHITAQKGTVVSKGLLNVWLKSNDLQTPSLKNKWATITNIINHISVVTLIVGLFCMAYLASLNIKNNSMINGSENKIVVDNYEKLAETAPQNNINRNDVASEEQTSNNSEGSE